MGKQDWTPEPWQWMGVWPDTAGWEGVCVRGGDNSEVLDFAAYEGFSIKERDARRAVACVNALAGIPDPAAYVKAVGLARENVQKAVDLIRYVNAESAHENFQLNEAIGLLKSILAWEAIRTLSTPESEVSDGHESADKCGPDCSLHVVRPGKFQCNGDGAKCPNKEGSDGKA